MEIRFSKDVEGTVEVENAAYAAGVVANVTSTFDKRRCVRFTVRKNIGYSQGYPYLADEEAHDSVIRALLTLDPDATVRTARAVYSGLSDFEKQRGKA